MQSEMREKADLGHARFTVQKFGLDSLAEMPQIITQ